MTRRERAHRRGHGNRLYTEAERQAILARAVPDSVLAQQLGRPARAVRDYRYNLRKRLGLPVPRSAAFLARGEIARLMAEGVPQVEVARRLGLTRGQVVGVVYREELWPKVTRA